VSEDLKAALEEAESELQAAYRKVWPLREAYAEVTPPAVLPSPRKRTDKQALIARCPRCGGTMTYLSDLENVVRTFMAFQNAGYLSGQPFEETYALLVKDARTLLRESEGAAQE
jgi:hypothetical protein